MPQLVKLAAAELFAGTRAEPREYQTRICASVLSMLDGTWVDRDGTQPDPASSVLIDAPTGAGKTVMGLALAQRAAAQGARVGWAAMRRNLLSQAERMIERFGFRIPGLQLISMFTHEPPSKLDWLFVDEAQLVKRQAVMRTLFEHKLLLVRIGFAIHCKAVEPRRRAVSFQVHGRDAPGAAWRGSGRSP